MLVEGIFKDVQLHGLVEVLEEDFPQVVAFADDDGILRIQIVEAGKSGTEHRMRRHVAEAAFIVEFLQSGLYRSDVADDAVFGQYSSTWRKASSVYFTVTALMTSSGSKSLISSSVVKR